MKKSKEESNENDDAGHSGVESSDDEDSDEMKSGSINATIDRPEKMRGSSKLTSVSKSAAQKVIFYLKSSSLHTLFRTNIESGLEMVSFQVWLEVSYYFHIKWWVSIK